MDMPLPSWFFAAICWTAEEFQKNGLSGDVVEYCLHQGILLALCSAEDKLETRVQL